METWKKVLIGLGVAVLLVMGSIVVGYRQVVTPPPAAPELSERPIPVVERSASPAPTGAFVFRGVVEDEEGQPVQTELSFSSASQEISLSSLEDGSFEAEVEEAGTLSLLRLAGAPDAVFVSFLIHNFCNGAAGGIVNTGNAAGTNGDKGRFSLNIAGGSSQHEGESEQYRDSQH